MCPKHPIVMATEADTEIMAQAVNVMCTIKPSTPDQSAWYGPYNTLLSNIFSWIGHGNGYVIVPQFEEYGGHSPIEITVQGQFFALVVEHCHHPVLFVEIKPRKAVKYIGTRAQADLQMRKRMCYLYEECLLSRLYGISAMGTLYAVYTVDTVTGELRPHGIPWDPSHSTDTAPKSWWCNDLLTQEGQEKLHTLFQEVKQMTVEKERQSLADEEMLGDSNDSG
jgi:hypothetical protein